MSEDVETFLSRHWVLNPFHTDFCKEGAVRKRIENFVSSLRNDYASHFFFKKKNR